MGEHTLQQLKVAPNGRAFDLPVLVGIEEGIFERHGLMVELSGRYEDRPLSERDVFARLKESQFEAGTADVYNVCEWASLDRLERGSRPGRVAVLQHTQSPPRRCSPSTRRSTSRTTSVVSPSVSTSSPARTTPRCSSSRGRSRASRSASSTSVAPSTEWDSCAVARCASSR